MSFSTLLFVPLAGLGITGVSYSSSSSVSFAAQSVHGVISDTLSGSSSTETNIPPLVSPSEEKILYPRIGLPHSNHSRILEQVSYPRSDYHNQMKRPLSPSPENESDDEGYDAEYEDERPRKLPRKARTYQFTHNRRCRAAATTSKKPYNGLGQGLPRGMKPNVTRKTAIIGLGITVLSAPFTPRPAISHANSPTPVLLPTPLALHIYPTPLAGGCVPRARRQSTSVGLGLGLNLPIAMTPRPVLGAQTRGAGYTPCPAEDDMIVYLISPYIG
ncbi:hypothetical protein B0H21DRAFT_729220 [Amylocystis lapponica]|nr:hypothetical protein B0H21DRAFT_729220 [Amylocystis lapponica]